MTRTCISLLALSLLASIAVASAAEGTESFEFSDPPLDTMPPGAPSAYADLVAGRVELADDETLVATIQVAALAEIQPGVAYVVVFSADGEAYYMALASAPTTTYTYGRWSGEGPSSYVDTEGSYSVGPGGSITITMPVAALQATRLTSLQAYAVDIKTGASPVPLPLPGFVVLDEAAGQGELLLPAQGPAANATESEPGAPAEKAEDAPLSEASTAPGSTTDEAPARTPLSAMLVLVAIGLVALLRR